MKTVPIVNLKKRMTIFPFAAIIVHHLQASNCDNVFQSLKKTYYVLVEDETICSGLDGNSENDMLEYSESP